MNLFLSVWRAMPRLCCVALAVFGATVARADGMVPDTSVVIVNEADGEATVSVTNTDNKMALLHVTLENIPEDSDTLLFVTPPLTRVEASKSQLVRFILQTQAPLQTQRLKRAIFEGMPAQRDPAQADHARGLAQRQRLHEQVPQRRQMTFTEPGDRPVVRGRPGSQPPKRHLINTFAFQGPR